MSMVMEQEDIKRWTAKRKSALVVEILQGKTTVAEASRGFDLAPSEIEKWGGGRPTGHGECSPRQSPRCPRTVRASDQGSPGGVRRGHAGASCPKTIAIPAGRGRQVIETIHQGFKDEGIDVSISQLRRWFGIPRRTVYYRPIKSPPKVQERLVKPIKAMIEENPSFGYRTVASLLNMNKNYAMFCHGWRISFLLYIRSRQTDFSRVRRLLQLTTSTPDSVIPRVIVRPRKRWG